MVHKYRAAQLKYEYVNMRGLPAPFNALSLPLSLVGALVGRCRCAGRKEGERAELPAISEAWLSILKSVHTRQAKLDAEEDETEAMRKLHERLDGMGRQLEKLKGLDRLRDLERAVEALSARLGKGKGTGKGGPKDEVAEEEEEDEFDGDEEESEEFDDDEDDEDEEEESQ